MRLASSPATAFAPMEIVTTMTMIGAIIPNVSIWTKPSGVVDIAAAKELEHHAHALGQLIEQRERLARDRRAERSPASAR